MSPEYLSKALADLLTNTELQKKLGHEGRIGVENHFDIAKHSVEIIDVYSMISNKYKQANYVSEA